MKKILAIAASALACAVLADDGILTSVGFESLSAGSTLNVNRDDFGYESLKCRWSSKNGSETGTIASYAGSESPAPSSLDVFNTQYPEGVEEGASSDGEKYNPFTDPGSQYLEVETGFGTLCRSLSKNEKGVEVDGSVYIDALVQFTVSNSPESYESGDKLLLYLMGDDSAGTTNLVIVSRAYYGNMPQSGIMTNIATNVEINEYEWHRLTIKSFTKTFSEDGSLPFTVLAFNVYIDGTLVSADGTVYVGGRSQMVRGASTFYSIQSGLTLSYVGFKGSGSLDNLVATTENPFVSDYKFQVGEVKYETFEEALAAAKALAATIKILKGVSGTLAIDADIAIDLNGQTVEKLMIGEGAESTVVIVNTASAEAAIESLENYGTTYIGSEEQKIGASNLVRVGSLYNQKGEGKLTVYGVSGTATSKIDLPSGYMWDSDPSGPASEGPYTLVQSAIDVYTITYDLAGGSVEQPNPGSYTAETDEFTLNNPVRKGYDFAGWTGSGLTTPTMEVTIPKGSSGEKAYYANWTLSVYTIAYDLAGGSETQNPAGYTMETATFTLNNPVREGYDFAGWTGTGLDAATMDVTIPNGSTGNRSYTATWTAVEYNIAYDLAGGSVATANPARYTAETATFTLNNPVREGFVFAGWTGTGLDAATMEVTILNGSTGDRSYTATWTESGDDKIGYEEWAQKNGIDGAWDETDKNGVYNVFRYVFGLTGDDYGETPLLDIGFNESGEVVVTTPPVENSKGFAISIVEYGDVAGTEEKASYTLEEAAAGLPKPAGERFYRIRADME